MVVSRRIHRRSIARSRSLSSLYEEESGEQKNGPYLLAGISSICKPSCKEKNLFSEWLGDTYDDDHINSECQTLECKTIAIDPGSLDALMVRNCQIAINQIRAVSVAIINEIDDMIDLLPLTLVQLPSYGDSFNQISHNIATLLDMCYGEQSDLIDYRDARLQIALASICGEMSQFIVTFKRRRKINNVQFEATLRKLKERVGEMVASTIKKGLELIVCGLSTARGAVCLKWSMVALWQLTKADHFICRLLVEQFEIVKKLIDLNRCHQMTLNHSLRAPIFRILAHVCLNSNALHLVYNHINMSADVIPHIIERADDLAREILTLMVQITIPFIDYKRIIKQDNTLSHFIANLPLEKFVRALTGLTLGNMSRDVFLMASTTLANISFLDSQILIKNDVLRVLLSTISKSTSLGNDLSVREQMMALLANIAAIDPLEVVYCGGLAHLIESFRISPNSGVHCESELTSLKRIRAQVEVTLRRLMKNEYLASFIQQISSPQHSSLSSSMLSNKPKSSSLDSAYCDSNNSSSTIKSWASSGNLPKSENIYSYRSFPLVCQYNHPPQYIFHHESYV